MDKVIDRLLTTDEKAVFQLFELITEAEKHELWTDNDSYIIAQSNENAPIWIWLSEGIGDNKQKINQVTDIIKERISKNPNVHFNAAPERFSAILQHLEAQINEKVVCVMQMNTYVLVNSPAVNEKGSMILASDQYATVMEALLIQLVEDGEHGTLPAEIAKQAVASMIASGNMFLWKDEGEICAMAMIAHRGEQFTRINTVVTDRGKRGKGYAAMLVSAMCRNERQNGKTVMLYADADNPASNRTYRKIGFQQTGQIAEYKLGR